MNQAQEIKVLNTIREFLLRSNDVKGTETHAHSQCLQYVDVKVMQLKQEALNPTPNEPAKPINAGAVNPDVKPDRPADKPVDPAKEPDRSTNQ